MARCAREKCGRRRPGLMVTMGWSGVRFEDGWYCSADCLRAEARARLDAVSQPPSAPLAGQRWSRLGALLVHQQALDVADLTRALAGQRESGRRLGEEVVALGLASEHDVLRALATQAGVKYVTGVDPSSVAHGPGGLSRDTVRALGVVPFNHDERSGRLRVACGTPVPRLAVQALAHLTRLAVEPFLVVDALWPKLMDAYGRAREAHAEASSTFVEAADAADRIVHAIAAGPTRVRHARCDQHVWVRLERATGVEDLFLPLPWRIEEGTCRAAHTSH